MGWVQGAIVEIVPVAPVIFTDCPGAVATGGQEAGAVRLAVFNGSIGNRAERAEIGVRQHILPSRGFDQWQCYARLKARRNPRRAILVIFFPTLWTGRFCYA